MGRNLPAPNWEPDSDDLALWGGGLASGPPRGQPSIRLGRAAPAHRNWWVSGSWRKVGGQSKTHPERSLLTFRFVGKVKSGPGLRIQLRCGGLERPPQAMLVPQEKEMHIAFFLNSGLFRMFSGPVRLSACWQAVPGGEQPRAHRQCPGGSELNRLAAESERRGQTTALVDCPLCIQFGSDICATNDVNAAAGGLQCVGQLAARLLTGADHHGANV